MRRYVCVERDQIGRNQHALVDSKEKRIRSWGRGEGVVGYLSRNAPTKKGFCLGGDLSRWSARRHRWTATIVLVCNETKGKKRKEKRKESSSTATFLNYFCFVPAHRVFLMNFFFPFRQTRKRHVARFSSSIGSVPLAGIHDLSGV
jgi:hypothetical protein